MARLWLILATLLTLPAWAQGLPRAEPGTRFAYEAGRRGSQLQEGALATFRVEQAARMGRDLGAERRAVQGDEDLEHR